MIIKTNFYLSITLVRDVMVYWTVIYFIVSLGMAIATYCCFMKKLCINVMRTIDTQLVLF